MTRIAAITIGLLPLVTPVLAYHSVVDTTLHIVGCDADLLIREVWIVSEGDGVITYHLAYVEDDGELEWTPIGDYSDTPEGNMSAFAYAMADVLNQDRFAYWEMWEYGLSGLAQYLWAVQEANLTPELGGFGVGVRLWIDDLGSQDQKLTVTNVSTGVLDLRGYRVVTTSWSQELPEAPGDPDWWLLEPGESKTIAFWPETWAALLSHDGALRTITGQISPTSNCIPPEEPEEPGLPGECKSGTCPQ